MNQKLTSKATIGIQKPVDEVFRAIVEPEQMGHYFISKSTGKLEQGEQIHWVFPEFDDSFPVSVVEVVPNERIKFIWDPNSIVNIELEKDAHGTIVKVTEEGRQNNEEGIKWAIQQTEGWANFLACMKAWLEYGVHLRKGAFDFMKKN
jgi:uncharacterized protein YndB with AHSA1/START domain